MDLSPTPFLKWAGGKTQLLPQFEEYFPARGFAQYHEPFVGSGAVYFYLHNRGCIVKARLSDSNPELVNCWQVIRNDVEELIVLLQHHKKNHSHDYYYQIRALDRKVDSKLSPVDRAARMIYLNRTCYNGLWRVNSQGHFNVPMGSYKNPRILDADNLRAASAALQHAHIHAADFRQVVGEAMAGDFVYFDPPYVPLSATSNFTGYTTQEFGLDDHKALADTFAALDRQGCYVMLSNSDTPYVRDLYAGYHIQTVRATRRINSVADGRGEVDELVILNYDPPVGQPGDSP
jgi:DNA adenine methylase